MRVTLVQEEIFQAISDYLHYKLSLNRTASITVNFTAGRKPRGYTADVEITYPRPEFPSMSPTPDKVVFRNEITLEDAIPCTEENQFIPEVSEDAVTVNDNLKLAGGLFN